MNYELRIGNSEKVYMSSESHSLFTPHYSQFHLEVIGYCIFRKKLPLIPVQGCHLFSFSSLTILYYRGGSFHPECLFLILPSLSLQD